MTEAESIKDLSMKLSGLVTNMRALGETVQENYMVKKLLRAVPARSLQITSAIEQFEEECVKREGTENPYLLLTREEWLKRSNKGVAESSQTWRNKNTGGVQGGRGADCRKSKKKKDTKLEASLALIQDDEPALLFMETYEGEGKALLLNEGDVVPKLIDSIHTKIESNVWYLDNGASNHMTGERNKFKELDESVTGKVKFGDGSTVEIKGKGVVSCHVNFQAMSLMSENQMAQGLPKLVKPRITPYEAWTGRKPDLSHLRIYGCVAHMKVPNVHVSKLDDRSKMRTWAWEESENNTTTNVTEKFTIVGGYSSDDSLENQQIQTPSTPRGSESGAGSFTDEGIADIDESGEPKRFRLLRDIYDETQEVEVENELLMLLSGIEEPLNY
ncbi:hypothetical protein AgCh_036706 [Apium graveolens]